MARHSLLLLCLAVLLGVRPAPAVAAQPPATAPVDAGTRDALSDIDAIAPSPAPPGAGRVAGAPVADEPARPAGPAWLRTLWFWARLFWPVLLTAAAIGVAGGVFGTFVLLRREALLALALPPVIATGAAVGMRLGWPTLPPALAMAAAALAYLAYAKRRGTGATALPAVYVAGLSVSFLVIANHGQDVADLEHLLTGVDVAVSPARAVAGAPLLILAAAACGLLWRRWLVLAQAPAAAELAGVHPARWDAAFLGLLAAALLLGTDSQGVVMVLALLFLPAGAVLPWARRLPAALVASAALSLAFVAAAFVLSNVMQWPLSQTVGGVGFAVFAASHAAAVLSGRSAR